MGVARYLTVPLLLLCAATSVAHERIALIIGANKGLVTERQLRFAVSDAKRVKEAVNELCRFEESRTYLLVNPIVRDIEKTAAELTGRIKEIRGAGKQVEFLFYYSGHGSSDALHIGGAAFTHDSLLSVLDAVHADLTIAIVDACYSGALVAEKGITIAPPLAVKLIDTLSARGTIMLTSSSPDQVSHESTDLGGSIFTHNLLSALRGAADYDGSGTVSLSEAYGYARMNTSMISGHRTGTMQQPSYAWDIRGKEEICLSWLSQSGVRLVMHSGEPCPHFVISEPAQTVVAEFTPRPNPVVLALPSGRYRIQRVCDNAVAYIETDLTWKNACTLSLGSLREFSRTAFTRKGPLDRPSATHLVNAGFLLLSAYPDAAAAQIMPAAAYVFNNGNFIAGFTCGYGRSRFDGEALTVHRSTIHLAASLSKAVSTSRLLMVDFGLETGVHFNDQRLFRPEEERLRAIGYPPLPVEKTAVPFAGICGRATLYILGRIPLGIIIGINDHIAPTDNGYRQFIRPYLGANTGISFSR